MSDFYVEQIDNFIDEHTTQNIWKDIISTGKFADQHIHKKRIKAIYGSIPEYSFTIYGKTVKTEVRPWCELPCLYEIANMLERITGQIYNVCVIQYYKNGDVGIKPHRDKEMKHGTIIASISIGETRTMRFEKKGIVRDFELTDGTLFLIHPPTNDTWLHSIPTQGSPNPRISLVFRNFS